MSRCPTSRRNMSAMEFASFVGCSLVFAASLAVSNRFGSLRGCCSIYLSFCTSHATLHRAHTRKEPLVEKLCRKQGFVYMD